MIQERPFLIPFAAMSSGLIISDQFNVLLPPWSLALLCCALLLSCFIERMHVHILCLALFFFGWGMSALQQWNCPEKSPNDLIHQVGLNPVNLEGIIQSRPVISPTGSVIEVSVEYTYHTGRPESVNGKMILYVTDGDLALTRGDRIRFITRLTAPRRLGLPGEFDYSRFLRYRGIQVIGRVSTQNDIVLIRSGAVETFARKTDLVARHLGDFIRSTVGDNDVSATLSALLIGDQKRISKELSDAYTRAGVNHILSVSGFHVGIIVYFIATVALLFARLSETLALWLNLRRSVLLLTVPAMFMYLLITGSAPATARSVIMLTVFVLAMCAERETDPINSLLMSATLLVAVHPPTLFDLSFQLSFLALWGIITLVPPVMVYMDAITNKWLRTVLQFITVSTSASLATLIPVLYTFNQASLNGILANFLIVPLLGYGAVLIGFCALPFMYLYQPVAHLLIEVTARIVDISNVLIGYFSHLPVIQFHGISGFDLLICVLCLCSMSFLRIRKIQVLSCVILIGSALIAHLFSVTSIDGRLHIYMLSVGQAESILICLPNGAVVLVDSGGYLFDTDHDFGEKVLAPALRKLDVRKIDYLVLTHSHPDHIGGMPFVAHTFPIGTFMETTLGGVGDGYSLLRARLLEKRVPVHTLIAGESINCGGGVILSVLSPPAVTKSQLAVIDEMGLNEESLVFRLNYKQFSMLFTADAGFPVENRLLSERAQLAATILKVGHHGSQYSTSTEFLERVSPQAALISAGYGNRFGLPSSQTLARLSERKIQVFRTDQVGTIELISDGSTWNIRTPYKM